MLQFLIGLSTLNVSWLFAGLFGGLQFYNSPPLFFVSGIVLLVTGFYSFHLRWDLLQVILVIAGLSILASLLHGFDSWHLRQGVAFIAAAMIWVYVYQVAWKRDIFTLQNSKTVLAIYSIYLILIFIERALGSEILPYLASCVFSGHCGANVNYFESGRTAFFSEEPAAATLAITATVMPCICAHAIVKRSWPALAMMMMGLALLYFSQGFTAQILIAFTVAFYFFPRLALVSVPVFMALIVVVAADVSTVLGEPNGVADLVQSWFGGIYSQIDQGIESGSYVSRAMIWLIGAHAFLSAPLTGLGIGGSQSYFFTLDNAGFYIVMGTEQSSMINGDTASYSSPMVVRIPAEIGLLGTTYLSYYLWKAFKIVFERKGESSELYYAYLYSLGAMLLTFCVAPEFFNPCISAFLAILAQTLRARQAFKSPAQVTPAPTLTASLGVA